MRVGVGVGVRVRVRVEEGWGSGQGSGYLGDDSASEMPLGGCAAWPAELLPLTNSPAALRTPEP